MAQEVSFFKNNVEYTEGPFVIVSVSGSWRIEAELKGHHCPVLPHDSILELIKGIALRPTGLNGTREEAAHICDVLNARVRHGLIVLEGISWVDRQLTIRRAARG